MSKKPAGISGMDVQTLEALLGARKLSMMEMLGLTTTRLYELYEAEEGALKPSNAILVRLLLEHPQYSILPEPKPMEYILSLVQDVDPAMNRYKLTQMLGYAKSATGRLFSKNEYTSTLSTLLLILEKHLQHANSYEERKQFWADFSNTVTEEAQSRGLEFEDVINNFAWRHHQRRKD